MFTHIYRAYVPYSENMVSAGPLHVLSSLNAARVLADAGASEFGVCVVCMQTINCSR